VTAWIFPAGDDDYERGAIEVQLPEDALGLLRYGAPGAESTPIPDEDPREVNASFSVPDVMLALHPKHGSCLRADYHYEMEEGREELVAARGVAVLIADALALAWGMDLEKATDYYAGQMMVGFEEATCDADDFEDLNLEDLIDRFNAKLAAEDALAEAEAEAEDEEETPEDEDWEDDDDMGDPEQDDPKGIQ